MDVDHDEIVLSTSGTNCICQFCARRYKRQQSLKRHVEAHENNEYSCSHCPKRFQTVYNMIIHIKRQHSKGKSEFICQHCGKRFNSKVATSNHIKFKHNNGGKLCNICSKDFKDNYALQRHLSSHDNKTDKCTKCGREFKDLESHLKKCGKRKMSRQYVCDICNKKYLCKRYLHVHIKNKHQGCDLFSCDCGNTYSYKCSLKRHQKMYTH